MRQRSDSLLRPLLAFGALGSIALIVVAVAGVVVVRRQAAEQALAEARRLTRVSASFVERSLTEGVMTGDARSLATIADAVLAVNADPVVRVKLWTRDGRVVYSDELRLIDTRAELDDGALDVIDDGGVASELSDLSGPENRFEASFGELFEIYTRIRTPDGTSLLFETYQRASAIETRQGELQTRFAPVLLITLLALAILMVPIAWMLASRVRASQRERERLLQGAVEAADLERRRIAGDLHDGPVQELAGLSMRLSAAAGGVSDGAAEILRDAASGVRASVRTLRSAIVGVYPPNLRTVGLRAALSDLAAATEQRGPATTLDVDPAAEGLHEDVDALIFRAAQEALRNAEEHANATRVDISVRTAGDRVVLTVADDGVGIDPGRLARAREEGHVGLSILTDLARSAGGDVRVARSEDGGTVVSMEVPRR
ncbi:MAG TPA: ATP-binding protein [Actinomycetota bacterium]|nr:ATP-binding protein [Actinomycetota bacterium]